MSTIRLCASILVATLAAGCGVAPYGAQVLQVRTQESRDQIARNCETGDQTACAVYPFVSKALAQAQQDALLPWR
jgi:hypothetical protein